MERWTLAPLFCLGFLALLDGTWSMDMLDSLGLSSTDVPCVVLAQEKGDTGSRWDLGCVVCAARVIWYHGAAMLGWHLVFLGVMELVRAVSHLSCRANGGLGRGKDTEVVSQSTCWILDSGFLALPPFAILQVNGLGGPGGVAVDVETRRGRAGVVVIRMGLCCAVRSSFGCGPLVGRLQAQTVIRSGCTARSA